MMGLATLSTSVLTDSSSKFLSLCLSSILCFFIGIINNHCLLDLQMWDDCEGRNYDLLKLPSISVNLAACNRLTHVFFFFVNFIRV